MSVPSLKSQLTISLYNLTVLQVDPVQRNIVQWWKFEEGWEVLDTEIS